MASLWDTDTGCGHGLNINHPPQPGAPKVAMVSPDRMLTIDRVQTNDEMPAWLDINML